MPRSKIVPSLPRWVDKLKFKIVAMAVLTGVLSAVVTTQFVLTTTKSDMLRLLLQNESDNRERTAAMLDSRVAQGAKVNLKKWPTLVLASWANPLCVLPHRCRAAMTATLHMGLEPPCFSSLNGARKG